MNCEIVYTRPEYMLAMLKGHARGKLAYVSTFKVSAPSDVNVSRLIPLQRN